MAPHAIEVGAEPPSIGSVIRYRYLWARESRGGLEDGSRARPAAIIVARSASGETIGLPITHTEPNDPATAVEVSAEERRGIGLDQERSWIIVSEINAFVWPSPDLELVPERHPETVVYGRLSKVFFTRVLFQVQTLIRAGLVGRVER